MQLLLTMHIKHILNVAVEESTHPRCVSMVGLGPSVPARRWSVIG